MATLNEMIYDVREALNDFSDDSELDNRYIIYLINIKRAKYLKQRLDQLGRNFNNRVLQTLCLDTELVSANECGLELECDKVVRTKRPIPKLLQLALTDALQRVAPSNKLSNKFNLIERERATSYLNSPFPNKIKAFLHDDDHVYLVSKNPIHLTCLSITGVFENPTELEDYKNCCDCDDVVEKCFDSDSEYPLQTELIDLVRRDIIQELLKVDQVPEDTTNNSQDD